MKKTFTRSRPAQRGVAAQGRSRFLARFTCWCATAREICFCRSLSTLPLAGKPALPLAGKPQPNESSPENGTAPSAAICCRERHSRPLPVLGYVYRASMKNSESARTTLSICTIMSGAATSRRSTSALSSRPGGASSHRTSKKNCGAREFSSPSTEYSVTCNRALSLSAIVLRTTRYFAATTLDSTKIPNSLGVCEKSAWGVPTTSATAVRFIGSEIGLPS